MGYVQCRSCHGIGKKNFNRRDKNGRYYEKAVDCKACSGTGINQKFYSKNCERCHAEIIYPKDANYPPKYCRNCKVQIQAEKQAERERQAAKWKEKSCKDCGATIKYNVDWNRIPELCPDCVAKEKAKWKEKKCKSCSATIKYNTEGGSVRVSLDADHKFFYIKVSDTGIGIPESEYESIFERFYRVDKARSRSTGGTGLGLSITKNIILKHKGIIKVSSKEEEGSTFTVRIPLNYIVENRIEK